jgi:transposase-like protein
MKEAEFQGLVAQLGGLSEVQRGALLEALKSKRPAAEALKLIEARFDAQPCCGHCGSHSVQPWGRASKLKRYRCKDCRRTFNALTGTPLAQLHRRDVWLAYGQALADGVSLRKAAKRCRIDLTTSFRWRHRFLAAAQDKKARNLAGVVEADETFFLRSQKGSRKIAGRAPRKRGGVAKKRGLSDEQIPVLIVRDRSKATSDAILPDLKGETIAGALRPIVARDALLVSDGAEGGSYRAFANREGILHVGLNTGAGQHRWGVYHIQNVNAYASGLKEWMRRFRGVATKYLPSYLGWRRMIDREGDRLTAYFCISIAAEAVPRST